jgi:hypothetical protein
MSVSELPQEVQLKLKKSMYRAVDLIETFFPDPDDVSKHVVLGPYQKDFVDCIQYGFPTSQFKFSEVPEPPDGVIYITRRQVGKSWMCGYACAALMILGPTNKGKPPCFCGIIAASEDESQYLIDKVKYCFDYSDFKEFVAGRPKLNLLKLTNGSFTRSHPCSEKSIRGPKYDYLFIDESAIMEEDILFKAALPTVEHGERWIAITTPQGRVGKFIDYYDKALETRPIICRKCKSEYSQKSFRNATFPRTGNIMSMPGLIPCKNCKTNDYKYGMGLYATPYLDPWKTPIIDQKKLKRTLDAHGWSPWARQEYLGEIVDEASMVILNEWIEKNTIEKLRNKMKLDTRVKYILGVDYGRSHDASSFCITHTDPKTKRIVLDFMETVSGEFDHETDYQGIHAKLGEIISFYRPMWVVPDATGVGAPQVEQLQRDLRFWSSGTKVFSNTKRQKGFIISRVSKPDLLGNLITLLSRNPPALMLPPRTETEIGELVTELLRFECKVEDAGYIRYGTQNYHDDRVIALALSLWGNQSSNWYSSKIKGYNYNLVKRREKSRSESGRNYRIRPIKDYY